MAESTFDIFPASKSTQKTMKLKHLILLVLSIDCLTNLYLFYFKQLFLHFMIKSLLVILIMKNNPNLLL